jgi:prephenate dehydrogenase
MKFKFMENIKSMKNSPEISVIGLGRFGTFWANHLSKFYTVYGYDIDLKPNTENCEIHLTELETCLSKDIIFLTIPISKMESFIKDNAHLLRKKSVVLDCASVKQCVVDWLQKYIPKDIYFASCHPLFGPDSARLGLKDKQISLMPGNIPYQKYNQIVDIFSNDLELNILNISAEKHDELMAYNLSLIHHLGRTFHKMEIFKLPLLMAGLEKLNHISGVVMNDSDQLFQDFYRYNAFAKKVKNSFIDSFNSTTPIK